jgi:uncharacterized membrane protein YtjA (UPF0391 family)
MLLAEGTLTYELREWTMETLLIVGIVLIVIALLGFGGIISALRSAAWLILVIAIVVIVVSFIF